MAEYNSKVVLSDGTTLIDLTADTVQADKLLSGYTAHGRDGAPITGSCTFDADTTDANAIASEILATKTAYVNGVKLTGTMPNNGGTGGTIDDVTTPFTIPQGYSDGSAEVSIDKTEAAKLQNTDNIRSGVTILGVTGTYEGEEQPTQAKSVVPTFQAQTVLPDAGYLLNQVNVSAISVVYTENSAGGYTVTIG